LNVTKEQEGEPPLDLLDSDDDCDDDDDDDDNESH